jgi:pimeloyl-ACP methyl ester carboxylesterase
MANHRRLAGIAAPALIAWGTDDVFDAQWSHWLARTIPGTTYRMEIAGGGTFFPEERPAGFDTALRGFWSGWS